MSRNIKDNVNVSIRTIHAEKEKTGTPKGGKLREEVMERVTRCAHPKN
jgi:hypothetical protein